MATKKLRRTVRKKTVHLVNQYGFSTDAIRIMQEVTPYLKLDKVVEAWAKELLAAESLEERRWHVSGQDIPLLEEHFGEKVFLCKPKAVSYQLPGGKYSPDYLYIFNNGMRVVVEVKGSTYQRGYKDAIAKMRAAATLHWYDRFLLVMWEKGAWQLQDMPPDKDYMTELQDLAAEVEAMDTTWVTEQEGG